MLPSYEIVEATGSLTNELIVSGVHPMYTKHYVSISSYTDDSLQTGVPITSGSAQILATEDGVNWGTVHQGDITFGETYVRPSIGGRISAIKAVPTGLVGGPVLCVRVSSYI